MEIINNGQNDINVRKMLMSARLILFYVINHFRPPRDNSDYINFNLMLSSQISPTVGFGCLAVQS